MLSNPGRPNFIPTQVEFPNATVSFVTQLSAPALRTRHRFELCHPLPRVCLCIIYRTGYMETSVLSFCQSTLGHLQFKIIAGMLEDGMEEGKLGDGEGPAPGSVLTGSCVIVIMTRWEMVIEEHQPRGRWPGKWPQWDNPNG